MVIFFHCIMGISWFDGDKLMTNYNGRSSDGEKMMDFLSPPGVLKCIKPIINMMHDAVLFQHQHLASKMA